MKYFYALFLFLFITLASYSQKNDTIITFSGKRFIGKIETLKNNYVIINLTKDSTNKYIKEIKIDDVMYCSNQDFTNTTDLNILKQRLNGHKSVYYKNTAAGYMKQAKISGILGVSFSALSGILMTYAISADIDNQLDKQLRDALPWICCGLAATSVAAYINGYLAMRKAGIILKKTEKTAFYLRPSANGASLVYTF